MFKRNHKLVKLGELSFAGLVGFAGTQIKNKKHEDYYKSFVQVVY